MNGIQYALRRVHHGETEAHAELLRIAERHHAEHEIHHVALDLASWSAEHVALLAKHASNHGLGLDADPKTPSAVSEHVRSALSVAVGRNPAAGLVLLEDLTRLFLRTSENSIAWEMLAQIAQAKHERELLGLTEECHPQTLRQIRWANTMIKTQTPQILSSV